jgi:hypothetical protein
VPRAGTRKRLLVVSGSRALQKLLSCSGDNLAALMQQLRWHLLRSTGCLRVTLATLTLCAPPCELAPCAAEIAWLFVGSCIAWWLLCAADRWHCVGTARQSWLWFYRHAGQLQPSSRTSHSTTLYMHAHVMSFLFLDRVMSPALLDSLSSEPSTLSGLGQCYSGQSVLASFGEAQV